MEIKIKLIGFFIMLARSKYLEVLWHTAPNKSNQTDNLQRCLSCANEA